MNIPNSKEVERQIQVVPFINHSESKRKFDQFDVNYGKELQFPILGCHYQLPDLPTSYVPSTILDTSLLHVRFNDISKGIILTKFYLSTNIFINKKYIYRFLFTLI